MGNAWITNILHYLDDDGNPGLPPGPARGFAGLST